MDTHIPSNPVVTGPSTVNSALHRTQAAPVPSEQRRSANALSLEATTPAVDQNAAATVDEVKGAAKQIEEFINTVAQNLQFAIDEDSGRILIRLIDNNTKEVIRQIPSKEILEIAKTLDKLQGLLISKKA